MVVVLIMPSYTQSRFFSVVARMGLGEIDICLQVAFKSTVDCKTVRLGHSPRVDVNIFVEIGIRCKQKAFAVDLHARKL
jgi:hypothetical protein